MRFKIGEQVVCLKKSWVIHPSHSYYSPTTLMLVEYRYDPRYGKECNFPEDCFAPLADISEVMEVLEQQPESV